MVMTVRFRSTVTMWCGELCITVTSVSIVSQARAQGLYGSASNSTHDVPQPTTFIMGRLSVSALVLNVYVDLEQLLSTW